MWEGVMTSLFGKYGGQPATSIHSHYLRYVPTLLGIHYLIYKLPPPLPDTVDTLQQDSGECSICLEDMLSGKLSVVMRAYPKYTYGTHTLCIHVHVVALLLSVYKFMVWVGFDNN